MPGKEQTPKKQDEDQDTSPINHEVPAAEETDSGGHEPVPVKKVFLCCCEGKGCDRSKKRDEIQEVSPIKHEGPAAEVLVDVYKPVPVKKEKKNRSKKRDEKPETSPRAAEETDPDGFKPAPTPAKKEKKRRRKTGLNKVISNLPADTAITGVVIGAAAGAATAVCLEKNTCMVLVGVACGAIVGAAANVGLHLFGIPAFFKQ